MVVDYCWFTISISKVDENAVDVNRVDININ